MSGEAAALLMVKGFVADLPEQERAAIREAVQKMKECTSGLSEQQQDIARTWFALEHAAESAK